MRQSNTFNKYHVRKIDILHYHGIILIKFQIYINYVYKVILLTLILYNALVYSSFKVILCAVNHKNLIKKVESFYIDIKLSS